MQDIDATGPAAERSGLTKTIRPELFVQSLFVKLYSSLTCMRESLPNTTHNFEKHSLARISMCGVPT